MKKLGIYIHIPFCASKCSYCAFYKEIHNPKFYEKYLVSLSKEIKYKQTAFRDYRVDTIYFGGGTPSVINEIYIKKIIELIKNSFNVSESVEITIEANPESFNEHKLEVYQSAGINRFSFGVQVYNDKFLEFLNRGTREKDVDNVIDLMKRSKIVNFNLDVIFALPNLTLDLLKTTLQKVVQADPAHISIYPYTPEPKTLLYELMSRNKLRSVSDEEFQIQADFIQDYLRQTDFKSYEYTNYAKPGFECKHNLDFWRGNEYLGFGPSAVSFTNCEFSENISSLDEYIRCNDFANFASVKTRLSFSELLEKSILLSMRLRDSFDLLSCYEKAVESWSSKLDKSSLTEEDIISFARFVSKYEDAIKKSLKIGYIARLGEFKYKTTDIGFSNFDSLAEEFVRG